MKILYVSIIYIKICIIKEMEALYIIGEINPFFYFCLEKTSIFFTLIDES